MKNFFLILVSILFNVNISAQSTPKVSILWESNLSKAALGTMFMVHTKKISFFVDYKFNWKLDEETGDLTNNPSKDTREDVTVHTNGDSYYVYTVTNTHQTGVCSHNKVLDFGIAKIFKVGKHSSITPYVGVGLFFEKKVTWDVATTGGYTYYHYAYAGYDVTYYHDFTTKYTPSISKTITANITGGVMYSYSVMSIGIGYDSNPKGLTIIAGLTF